MVKVASEAVLAGDQRAGLRRIAVLLTVVVLVPDIEIKNA